VDVVESVVAVSPDGGKCSDDHDWNQHNADEGSRGQNKPAIRTCLVHLFPGVEGIVRTESIMYAICRSVRDVGGKERLESRS
jgi:hypothetical protein